MKKQLTSAERLIVAADFKPVVSNGRDWVRTQVLALADSLKGTGVYLKINSALRVCGYELIHEIKSRGLRVFADLKLFDISETLSIDGVLLQEFKPELLTTVCGAGEKSLKALKAMLPETEVLGVTVLTSLTEEDARLIHGGTIYDAAIGLTEVGRLANLDGFIASAKEAELLRGLIGPDKSINTPGIRPSWAIVQGEDQNPERIMTPAKAILAGADRLVVGRPITQAKNQYDAVMRTIDEIASAVG